ncbi:hypothetical protein HanRHA438_Chr17g0793851 [Helianthus annuus]|nr:hypothetical protein HanRHA438_Chr17g0793851 [Helianthus annuus]
MPVGRRNHDDSDGGGVGSDGVGGGSDRNSKRKTADENKPVFSVRFLFVLFGFCSMCSISDGGGRRF